MVRDVNVNEFFRAIVFYHQEISQRRLGGMNIWPSMIVFGGTFVLVSLLVWLRNFIVINRNVAVSLNDLYYESLVIRNNQIAAIRVFSGMIIVAVGIIMPIK